MKPDFSKINFNNRQIPANFQISADNWLTPEQISVKPFYTFAQCAAARFLHRANPYDPSGIVQDGAVYTYVGSDNIYQPIAPLPRPGAANSLEDPLETAGPRRLWEDSHQVLRRHSGSRSSSRPHSAHRRRPLRFIARSQLLALGYRSHHAAHHHRQAYLAAAIRRHIQPNREPHALFELRRDVVARSARAILDRQRQPVSRAVFHAPGRGRRKVRARPAHSAHGRVLPHARAFLLSGKRRSGRPDFCLAGPRSPQWR